MNTDMQTALRRLELAAEFLSECDSQDWYPAFVRAGKRVSGIRNDDWAAIRDLIVIATHGAPLSMSYVEPDFFDQSKNDKGADPF